MSIIEFNNIPEDMQELESMTPEQLLTCQAALQKQIAELDAKEPRNMNSEAYEAWAEEHEQMEDLLDEILDLLEG